MFVEHWAQFMVMNPLTKTVDDPPRIGSLSLSPWDIPIMQAKKSGKFSALGCARKLGSMVSKWVITYL